MQMNEEKRSLNSLNQQKPWGKLTSLTASIGNFSLFKESYTIGRQSNNDIMLADIRISGVHCKIYRDSENNYWVEDLSSNGTYIESIKIGKCNKRKISSGDKLYLIHPGQVELNESLGLVFSAFEEEKNGVNKRQREETADLIEKEKKLFEKNLKFQEELGEEMKCCICIDYIYQCVTLIPCLHNFCAACFSQWMKKSNCCPQCREEATELRKNHTVNNIIEKFLLNNPEKRRPQKDYDDMDSKNTIKEDRLSLKKTETNSSLKFPSFTTLNLEQRFLDSTIPPFPLRNMPIPNTSIADIYSHLHFFMRNSLLSSQTHPVLPIFSNYSNLSNSVSSMLSFNNDIWNNFNNNPHYHHFPHFPGQNF